MFCWERDTDRVVGIDLNEILEVQKLAEEIVFKLHREVKRLIHGLAYEHAKVK